VKVAYEFALKHPGETLIVVTGDHETGGLTLGLANTGITGHIERLALQKRTYGQLEHRISHLMKDDPETTLDEIKPFITRNFGLKFTGEADDPMLLTAEEIAALEDVFQKQYHPAEGEKASGSIRSLVIALCGKRTGLTYTTGGHSALPVITSAYGVGAERFTGEFAAQVLNNTPENAKGDFENTYISQTLKELVK
jgi:alkaline phosphatase